MSKLYRNSPHRLDPELGWVRRCLICQVERPHSEFYKNKTDTFGIQKRCKNCDDRRKRQRQPLTAEEHKTHYQRYKVTIQQRSKEYYRTLNGRLRSLVTAANGRARRSGVLEFDLTFEWLSRCWAEQNGCCLLTGIPLDIETPVRDAGVRVMNPFSPSLDRIDCRKGYTQANTRLVCVAANLAINTFGSEVFDKVVECIALKRGWTKPST